jgi:two-component system nitrate/nitrite sensor histidine kinase NarX
MIASILFLSIAALSGLGLLFPELAHAALPALVAFAALGAALAGMQTRTSRGNPASGNLPAKPDPVSRRPPETRDPNEMPAVDSVEGTDRDQERRSLEILYDIAATINSSRDLDDLLIRTIKKLMGVVGAYAASIRLLDEDGRMRVVKNIGSRGKELARTAGLPRGGNTLSDTELVLRRAPSDPEERSSLHSFLAEGATGMIGIPLHYQHRNLGIYNLYTNSPELAERKDIQNLLTSIGKQLGMAIEKARLDRESRRLSIIQERTRLSHELHDSLAQTLASLRFQVRNLDTTIQSSGDYESLRQIEQIEAILEQANTELRELIAHFRAPVDKRGLVATLEAMIGRFRAETHTLAFFQPQWDGDGLPISYETEIARIVQEALTNARKHSEARTVRVMMRRDEEHQVIVLVEDDGVGMDSAQKLGGPGEHVGISTMEERARRIGGQLRIESEPGEGTRVELTFPHSADAEESRSTGGVV